MGISRLIIQTGSATHLLTACIRVIESDFELSWKNRQIYRNPVSELGAFRRDDLYQLQLSVLLARALKMLIY